MPDRPGSAYCEKGRPVSVYALLVGIDAYREPIAPLRGCRNDIQHATQYLERRVEKRNLHALPLLDGDATRAAVIDAFRGHLGQAGPGDTALFWFSGHGSQAPVPPGLAHIEPTGMMQTMLCVDSRHGGVPDLFDKELALLIGEVAARGVHTAVVVDCCHAESIDRAADSFVRPAGGPAPRLTARWVPALVSPPALEDLLAELRPYGTDHGFRGALPGPGPGHVALAACRSDQVAYEVGLRAGHHGVFTAGLVAQLERLGPDASYRRLLTGVRWYIENLAIRQTPMLYPIASDLADQPFLGGAVRTPISSITMRYVRGAWEIDAGSVHGVQLGVGDDRTRVGVRDASSEAPSDDHGWTQNTQDGEPLVREAEVVRVLPYTSVVEPVGGWQPDPATQFPVVITSVPLPPALVTIGGDPDGDQDTEALLARAVAGAAPDRPASPHVRVASGPAQAELCVVAPRPGVLRLLGADGTALAPDTCGVHDPEAAAKVVADLEHIVRWRRIKALDNPRSALAGAVRIEIVEALPGEEAAEATHRGALPADESGAVALEYTRDGGNWIAPEVFIRLRNMSGRQLYCVLLDMTDRFLSHVALFPGDLVAPRYTAWAAYGDRVVFSLPDDQVPEPGVQVTDWLKVLIAEEPFNAAPFELPRLGRPVRSTASRGERTFRGVLDRLGLTVMLRDAQARRPPALDWATDILPVVTRVPAN